MKQNKLTPNCCTKYQLLENLMKTYGVIHENVQNEF